jgi:hypothetical protein
MYCRSLAFEGNTRGRMSKRLEELNQVEITGGQSNEVYASLLVFDCEKRTPRRKGRLV